MARIGALVIALVALASSAINPLSAAAASGATVCLNIRDIERTEVPADNYILFHLRSGEIWRNDLRRACPMLKVSPFTEKLNGDLLCANQQFIHLTLTGDDCALGDFTRVAPPN